MKLIISDGINGSFLPNENYTGRQVMALINQSPYVELDDILEELKGLICDINIAEITSHIADGSLSKWIDILKSETVKTIEKCRQ